MRHFLVILTGLFLLTGCGESLHDRSYFPPQGADTELDGLLNAALADTWTYDKLGELCDTIGPRLTGSPGMQAAIEWSARTMREAGFDGVWLEPVTVPHWTRGQEWARCTSPVKFDLDLSGLGSSDGTGPDGIEAEIMAVADFDELEARAAEATGKIVLFNPDWRGYGYNVQYRVNGASAAARHGAVAALVRSATGVSLGAPHTGMMHYDDKAPRIPVAALTVEDAARLHNLCRRGLQPTVKLYMEAENHPETISYNVIGDIRGARKPDEIVLVCGHLDSWDVGTCAHDDGGGCLVALGAAGMLLKQNLRPDRTVRVVHFTCEEMGGYGGRAYRAAHAAELDRHILAIESDSGVFAPRGFSVRADSTVLARVNDLCRPLAFLAPGQWTIGPGWAGVDIGPIVAEGVPGVGHRVDGTHYMDLHHSRADTFDKVKPDELAHNVAAVAGLLFQVANDPVSLREITTLDGGH